MKRLENNLRGLLFAKSPGDVPGMSARGKMVYRRQVRNSLKGGVLPAIPLTKTVLGADTVDALLDDWLAQSPPTTRFYWQLPLQFADWMDHAGEKRDPALVELIRWETVEVDVLNAPAAGTWTHGDFGQDDARIEIHPSARLCIQRYPVHEMREGDPLPPALPSPTFVLAYRHGERFRWKIVDPQVAQLLALTGDGVTLADALTRLDEMYGGVNRPWLRAELELLAHDGIVRAVPPDDVA